MKSLMVIVGVLLSFEASATGGFYCDYKNKNIEFALEGVTTRSFENDIVDAAALLTGKMGDDGFIFNAEQRFVKSDIRQYWNSGEEFRIVLYAETDDSTTLVRISTRQDPQGLEYRGTISILQTSFKMKGYWEIKNHPITCGTE